MKSGDISFLRFGLRMRCCSRYGRSVKCVQVRYATLPWSAFPIETALALADVGVVLVISYVKLKIMMFYCGVSG